jgi:hypothetical protein
VADAGWGVGEWHALGEEATMSGPQGSWNDKHYVYRPPWGSGGDAYGDAYDDRYGGDAYTDDSFADDSYAADGYGDASYDDGYGDAGHGDQGGGGGPYEVAHERPRAAIGDSMRGAFGGLAWRYRSAPFRARVTVEVSAAVLVLALLLGASLALRAQGGPDQAESATGDATTSTSGGAGGVGGPLPTGSDALAPTSSTTTATTQPATSAPTTTRTTVAPTTATTAAPPTTAGPPATTTTTGSPPGEPHYRNCLDAWRDGALPLFEGEPGYSRRLDDDGDGQACEFGEGF